jgi:hypothetical protein
MTLSPQRLEKAAEAIALRMQGNLGEALFRDEAIDLAHAAISAYLGDTHVDGWQEVERAPILGSDDEPKIVLVWVADGGHGKGSIASGRCYKLADGKVRSSAIGFYGNWNITHWMPMPDGPLSAELTERDAG